MIRVFKKTGLVILGLIFFFTLYPVKMAQYLYERFKGQPTSVTLYEVFAEVFYTVQDALKVVLPQAQDIKEETKTLTDQQKSAIAKAAGVEFDLELDKEYHFYIGQANGQIVGYAVEDLVKGKWGPIHYMLSFEPDGKIKDILVLELKERRGRPVKERRFLDQYIGKSIANPIKLNKDIKGVAGATISSRGMSNGVRKMVYTLNELYKK